MLESEIFSKEYMISINTIEYTFNKFNNISASNNDYKIIKLSKQNPVKTHTYKNIDIFFTDGGPKWTDWYLNFKIHAASENLESKKYGEYLLETHGWNNNFLNYSKINTFLNEFKYQENIKDILKEKLKNNEFKLRYVFKNIPLKIFDYILILIFNYDGTVETIDKLKEKYDMFQYDEVYIKESKCKFKDILKYNYYNKKHLNFIKRLLKLFIPINKYERDIKIELNKLFKFDFGQVLNDKIYSWDSIECKSKLINKYNFENITEEKLNLIVSDIIKTKLSQYYTYTFHRELKHQYAYSDSNLIRSDKSRTMIDMFNEHGWNDYFKEWLFAHIYEITPFEDSLQLKFLKAKNML